MTSSTLLPSTRRLYSEDPYLLAFDARVLELGERQGQPTAVLDQTAFYPESGGQPWDTGTLDGIAVVAVMEDADSGVIRHVLERPLSADTVHGEVNAARRQDHRQQHHGQHLLSRAFLDLAGARTVSFHLGAEEVSIDLHREVSPADVAAAEARVNAVVRESRPVRWRSVSPEEARARGVEPPEGAGSSVRLVEADGYDLQACGGTHPRSTAEVGVVLVLGVERYKGGSRVRFACGDRAIAAFRQRNEALSRLGALLSSPLDRVVENVAGLTQRLADAETLSADRLDRALQAEARQLLDAAPGSPAVVVASFEGRSPGELRALALHLTAIRPCVALLGGRDEKAHLVFAQSDGLPHDVPGLLREAAQALGGRGGGKGNIAQGGGDRIGDLEAALHQAELRVRAS